MFYLGNYADIDTDETDDDTENGLALLGDYGRPPTIVVTETDTNDDGIISDNENNTAPDWMSYDIGAGTQTFEIDSTSWYIARLTLGDGTTQDANVGILQMENGDVFVRDVGNSLDGLNITRFELTSLQNSEYAGSFTGNSIENSRMVCFLQGTLIETDQGEKAVETLRIGDRVCTADNGFQTIRWICSSYLKNPGKHAPIVIARGALGHGLPVETLRVSPQHRILLGSKIAARMFGRTEVLLPAKRLTQIEGIRQDAPTKPLTYWHILTDRHELVRANGAWAETLFPGPEALKTFDETAKAELRCIMPMLFDEGAFEMARFEPPARHQKQLVARHLKNAKPLSLSAHAPDGRNARRLSLH